MAVSAIELRPRTSVGLLDAAIRFGGRSTGAWLLTLPGSLALCASLIVFLEAAEKGGSLVFGVWLVGLAWCLRGLCQGAACHHLERQLLDPDPALAGASVRAALRRAPSLLFNATVLSPLHVLGGFFTLGLGPLLWPGPQVTYAVAMHRRGPVHLLWSEAGNALGASKPLALRVRWLLPFQALLLLNLHIAVQFALSLARSLFGLDVAQLSRMAAFDNPGWWMLLLVVAFAVMEPVRAATAVLLLLDARVRREGMDLHARLAALPSARRGPGAGAPSMKPESLGKVALLLGLLSLPTPALAQPSSDPGPRSRLERLDGLVQRCTGRGLAPQEVEALTAWTHAGSLTLTRWVERHERAVDAHGCGPAMHALSRDLAAISGSAPSAPSPSGTSAAVREILSRPEFEVIPPKTEEGGFAAFLEWLERVLERWLSDDDEPEEKPHEPPPAWAPGSGLGLSRMLLWTLPLLALLAAIWVLTRHLRHRRPTEGAEAQAPAAAAEEAVEAGLTALSNPPATWLQLADGLAAQGRHRDAIRSAYLATLSGLHEQGRIRYDPNHSNWDHLMGFRGGGDARAIFRELTLRFDSAWYGAAEVDSNAWQRVRGHTVRLIGQEPFGEAAGA